MSRRADFVGALESFLQERDNLKSVAARCGYSHLDSALADSQLNGDYLEARRVLDVIVETIRDDIDRLEQDAASQRETDRWKNYPG